MSDSSDGEPEALLPHAMAMLVKGVPDDDGDDEEGEKASGCRTQGRGDIVPSTPIAKRPEELTDGQQALPSATDLDALADASFLHVAPALAEEPGWRLTPAQQAAVEAKARREAAERLNPAAPCSLPSYRYGRGLNMLQLGVELSARAAKRGPGTAAASRSTTSSKVPRRDPDHDCEAQDVGGGVERKGGLTPPDANVDGMKRDRPHWDPSL